jgi:hypothetical protein
MNTKRFSSVSASRIWMAIVLTGIVVFTAACGNSAGNSANSAQAPDNNAANPVVTDVPAAASSSADACSYLTKDDVAQALGIAVDSVNSSGMGGTCTYTAGNLSISLSLSSTGGVKAMNTTLTNLGDLALVVPGLGDLAFYNTNSANALFVLKGDAEFLFNMSDINYQPLDSATVQANEKALAEALLSHLP